MQQVRGVMMRQTPGKHINYESPSSRAPTLHLDSYKFPTKDHDINTS